MINFLKRFTLLKYLVRTAQPGQFTGALLDTRSDAEKSEDVHFSEIVGTASAVLWKEKYPDLIRRFPDFNQGNTGMCGAFSLRKSLGIMYQQKYNIFLDFFAPDIYQRRINKPQAGMILYDVMSIAAKGVTLTQFFNSTFNSDDDADAIKIEQWQRDVGATFSVSGSVKLPVDIDTIASVIQTTGKAPIALGFFTAGEWSKEAPYIVENGLSYSDPSALHHFYVFTDYSLYGGKKALVIEDSAWFGGLSRRILTEDWIKGRIIEIAYPMNFKFSVAQGDKPSYDGVTIVSAQKCLQYEGFFPTNIGYVENVGTFTRKALQLFQQKYGIPQTQTLDVTTVNKLAQIYP